MGLILTLLPISIHAPRMGSDTRWSTACKPLWYFNPRSPDGERREGQCTSIIDNAISIHAPRMGSDRVGPGLIVSGDVISIHAPRMGSDRLISDEVAQANEFQSTLPGWGATLS